MSSTLLQIAPAGQADGDLLPAPIQERLQALYDRVPGVSCGCDRLGQCCWLTEAEAAVDFATMFPLYPVEYLNIVDYVRRHFDLVRQEALLGLTEERPERCPFLTEAGGCSIHPARPLVCRTYGVLGREEVAQAAEEAKGEVPENWVRNFLATEQQTVCPHTRVEEPEKVVAHAKAMVSFAYERALLQMGREVEGLDETRQQMLQSTTGLMRITRWTWGGFNTLLRSPVGWLKRYFLDYWKAAFLGE